VHIVPNDDARLADDLLFGAAPIAEEILGDKDP